MAWRVARSLSALLSAFNTRFPNRDHATDGSIGDAPHQLSPSGHNPDDTPGSLPESQDADNEAEVRALDIDDDLNTPGATMAGVVQAILATPQDRDRLLYIIYDRKIWSKSQAWRERAYTGSDPHDSHAHLSGDPAYDEDTRPWTSVLTYGLSTQEDDDMFVIKGSNGTYLVEGRDAETGKPIATAATDKAVADYRAAGIRYVEVHYVNPDFYAIKKPPLATATVDTAALVDELARRLPKPLTAAETAQAAFEGAQRAERE